MKPVRYFIGAILMAAVLTGCHTRIEPYYPRENRPGNSGESQNTEKEKELVLTQNKTWTITYAGRKVVRGETVEDIRVTNVPAGQKFLVSVINRPSYASYEGDLAAFFKNELAECGDYVYQGGDPSVIFFDPFRHGTWYAFIIGLDNNKQLTGEFAYEKFEVEEEVATDEYLAWIGAWTVSDGKMEYEITVSQEEANMVYRVDGWEVRKGVKDWEQMDQEYIETYFDAASGNMYFVSQYITSYDDESLNGSTVDELFMGQIDYDGILEPMGLYIIPEENFDLAYSWMAQNGKAVISPCNVSVKVGKDVFEGKFHCMQYMYQEVRSGNWYLYNQDVAKLPMTMDKKQAVAAPLSIVKRSGKAAAAEDETPRSGKVHKARSGRVVEGVML